MADLDRVADIVTRLASQPGARMLLGTATATPGEVVIGASTLTVGRWAGTPAGEGQHVAVFLQGGAAVAVALGEGGSDLILNGDYAVTAPGGANQRSIIFRTSDYPEQDIALRHEVGDVNLPSGGSGLQVKQADGGTGNTILSVEGGTGSGIWVNGTQAGGDTGWLPLSGVGYASPWRDHSAVWKPYYRRINGFVCFRGLVNPSAATASGALLCTMPAGYRPANVNGQSNGMHLITAQGDYQYQYVRVYGSGRIDLGRGVGAGVWVSLDPISYPVD